MTAESPVDSTGDDRVDNALRHLDELDDLAVEAHVEHYERVHADLQDTLNAVERD
ncbi:MAG: hypothetical protein ABJA34_09005 [Pseudonocardiales bacterium]